VFISRLFSHAAPPTRLSRVGPCVLLFLCALFAPSAGAVAQPLDPPSERAISHEQQRFERLLDEATSAPAAGAIARVIDAWELAEWVEPRLAMLRFERLAEVVRDPDAAALAAWFAAVLASSHQDVEVRDALLDAQGWLWRFSVLGPFPNDGMAGFRQILGPEVDGPDPNATYQGRSAELPWRPITDRMPHAYFHLARLFAPDFASVAYVATEISLDRPMNGFISLAIDGAWRLWVNGVPTAELSENLGGFAVRDRVPVSLPAGTSVLVWKVAVDDGPWGLHARLLDPTGAPVRVQHQPLQRAAAPLASADRWPAPETLAHRFTQSAATDPPSNNSAADIAFVLRHLQSADPSEPWLRWVQRARDVEGSTDELLRLARVPREAWEATSWLADAVARADADDPEPAFRAAEHLRHQLGGDVLTEARAQFLALQDRSLRARAGAAEILRDEQMDHRALRALDALRTTHGALPAVRRRWAAAVRAAQRDDLLVEALTELLAVARDATGDRIALADALLQRGRAEEARALLFEGIARDPLAAELHQRIAELADAAGEAETAEQAWRQVASIRPGSAEPWERRGRLLLARGNRAEAARALQEALDRAPQNAVLRDLLAHLEDDRPRFWHPWRIEDAELLELSAAHAPEDDVDVVQLVDQRLTEVHPGGLSTTWVQQAWRIRSRAGAESLRALGVTFTPDSELVDVLRLRVIRSDGRVLDSWQSAERGPGSGPADIYFDVRSRLLYPPALEPGDVLVWEYTVSHVAARNLFDDYFGSVWLVQSDQPRAFARWGVLMPAGRPLWTNAEHLVFGSFEERLWEDGRTLHVVVAQDVPRVRREPSMPGWAESYEWLSVSTYREWDPLASWYWDLIRDQLVVSPAIEASVAELSEGIADRRALVGAVHRWVVRNIRYVGLEFGIHGYKPYRTSDCHARRFGDCKDTASLIKVMLGLLGIDAHIVLVRTSDLGRVDASPPSLHVFNHAIVYVPEFDLYLDGTAAFSGSSELPTMDQGASALHILDGRGGRFTTIPMSDAADHRVALVVDVSIDDQHAAGSVRIERSGAFASRARRQYEEEGQRMERLERSLAGQLPGVRLADAAFSDMRDTEGPVWIEARIADARVHELSAGRAVVRPLGTRVEWLAQLAGTETRRLPLRIEHPWILDHQATVQLPAGWRLEQAPESASLETPWGRASLAWALDAERQRLEVTTSFALTALAVPADEYREFRAFVVDAERLLEPTFRFATSEAP
jgi:tetratricopeptide (TPR) repeat protein